MCPVTASDVKEKNVFETPVNEMTLEQCEQALAQVHGWASEHGWTSSDGDDGEPAHKLAQRLLMRIENLS